MSLLRVGAIFVVFIPLGRLECQEWRYFKPSLKSQVQKPRQSEATILLREFCSTEIRLVAKIGATCSVRALGSNFADITDRAFHPQGVVFGHFLGPDSEDAAVSGWSAETHPYLWGGTLLLTKRNGGWKPLWYKSALITRSCEKVATPDRRDILLCEDEDGGMGHQLHYLYAVDLRRGHDSRENLLIQAESFRDGCTAQSQVMDPIVWRDGDRSFSVVVRTTEWRRLSATACNGVVSRRPPASVQTVFEVNQDGIKKTKAP